MERLELVRTFVFAAVVSTLVVASPAAADGGGLVAYWKLDEGSGPLVADSSGYGNNGTLVGNATPVPGHAGLALSFDGSGRGWVEVPDSSSLEPTSAVTVTAWVKGSGSPGLYRYIVAKGAGGCNAASYGLYSGHDGGLEFYVSTGQGAVYADSPDAGASVWNGQWHFVAGTYDGATVRLYVDGAQVGARTQWTRPLQYSLSDSNDLTIGDYPGCRSEDWGFRGAIDEVAVWNRALSAAEVAPGLQPPMPPPAPRSTGTTPPAGTSPALGQSPAKPAHPGGTPTAPAGRSAPELTFLNLVPAMFRLRANSSRSGTTISYTATQADVATLTVLRPLPGAVKRGRCVKPSAVRSGRHLRSCTRLVTVGSFSHVDQAGRNRFHFGGLRNRRLTPGRYWLEVTPRAYGERGQTLTATFWVLR